MASFFEASARLADPKEMRKVRKDLPIYIFSGGDDPVGQRLDGVHLLADRYRNAGVKSISCDSYPGGRHEMLHDLNRRDVVNSLLVWMSGIVEGPSSNPPSCRRSRNAQSLHFGN